MSGTLPTKHRGGRPQTSTLDEQRARANALKRADRRAKSTKPRKPKRGRPVTVPGGKAARLTLRVPAALRARVEARAVTMHVSVSDAVCALLDLALRGAL